MAIPRQLSLGEVIGQKKGKAQPKPRPVSPGRPRRELDVELLRALRAKGYGYKRISGEYTLGSPESASAIPLCGSGWLMVRTQPGTLGYYIGHIRVRRLVFQPHEHDVTRL
jgi:hypothetical protein